MTTAVATTPAPARTCPFVGPRSFRYREPLFGRDREVPKILDLLIAERIVLLFSPSGAGKTSLIQARLIPELRDEGFYDLPIIRVKQPSSAGGDEATGGASNRYIRSTLASLEARRPDAPGDPPTRLGDLDALEPALRRWADALRGKIDARPPRLVLIFDQFEEILTTDPTDHAAKEAFFDQLGRVLREDQGLWALFAMREEFVAALEPYLNHIPRRLSSRFRLDLLDAGAARQAFEEPFKSRGITVTPAALNKLVADLSRVRVQDPDGTTVSVPGSYVEPVHLQIVGLRLWNRFAVGSGFAQLDETHLSGTGASVDAALAGYYAESVGEISSTVGVGERAIREWCEGQLLTDQGLRGQVLREPGQTRGLPEPVIQKLIDAYLVRAEHRHGSTWYELAHDRLIEPVRDNNREWRQEHLRTSLLRVSDWDRAKKPDTLLLRDRELAEVETWARDNDAILSDAERDFLRISRKAWDEEQARRRRLVYQRGAIAIIVGLLAVSSLIGYFWRAAVSARDRAQDFERRANLARKAAQEAKSKEEQQAQRANRLAAELALDHGINLCRQGRTDDGLLWLMRGLEQAHETGPPDPALDRLARLELAAWRPEVTSLRWFQKLNDRVLAIASSPDGRTAITGGEGGTMRLWDLASGLSKEPRLRHDGGVLAVAFAPDGRTAITGGEDGTARLWDLASGQPEPRGPALQHAGPVDAVALSRDGRIAMTGSLDETARLWDVATGRPKWPPLKCDVWVKAVALSRDGRSALAAGWDGTLLSWNVESGQPDAPTLKYDDAVSAVAFGYDRPTVLRGSWDGTVQLWDLAARQSRPAGPPLKHDGPVGAVAMSADGRTAITGSWDRTARVSDVDTWQPKGPALDHERGILAAALGADGRTAITGSWDKVVRLWDVAPGWLKRPPLDQRLPASAAVFSPDGRTAITGGIYGELWRWNVDSGQPEKPSRLVGELPVEVMALGADGRTVITGDKYGTARLWDADSGQPKGPPLAHGSSVYAVAMSADGRTAITGGQDGMARLWNLASGRNEPKGPPLRHGGPVLAVAMSPDGRTAITGGDDGTARLWDLASGTPMGSSLKHDGGIMAVALSRDGRTALTGSWDRTARLWDVPTQQPKGLPMSHGWPVTGTAFSPEPDGTLVLTSSTDGTAQLWLAETQRAIGAPFSHRNSLFAVLAVAFSPDGRSIITASADGTARLWETPTAVEGSLDQLAHWIRVVTTKELDKDTRAIRSIGLDAWQKHRDLLYRLGGPPDRPAASETAVTKPRSGG
jgi:WD40 repeat protein